MMENLGIVAFDQAYRNTGWAIARLHKGRISYLEAGYWSIKTKASRLDSLLAIKTNTLKVCNLVKETSTKIGVTEEVFTGTKRANNNVLIETKTIVDLTLYEENFIVGSLPSTSHVHSSWRYLLGLNCKQLNPKEKKEQTKEFFRILEPKNDHIADALGLLFASLVKNNLIQVHEIEYTLTELTLNNQYYESGNKLFKA